MHLQDSAVSLDQNPSKTQYLQKKKKSKKFIASENRLVNFSGMESIYYFYWLTPQTKTKFCFVFYKSLKKWDNGYKGFTSR